MRGTNRSMSFKWRSASVSQVRLQKSDTVASLLMIMFMLPVSEVIAPMKRPPWSAFLS